MRSKSSNRGRHRSYPVDGPIRREVYPVDGPIRREVYPVDGPIRREVRPRRLRLTVAAAFLFAVPLLLVACEGSGSDPKEITLPQTPILSAGPKWAVVEEPYVRLFEEPNLNARVAGYGRQGSVLVVESQTNYRAEVKGREAHWYLLEGEVATGWAFGAHLKLFVSRDRADNAATFYER